jgi:uncharacterized membrane-anchored protein
MRISASWLPPPRSTRSQLRRSRARGSRRRVRPHAGTRPHSPWCRADNAEKSINYNTYALGRDGYFSLNLLTGSERIASEKAVAHDLLAALSYGAGKRYEDFSASTDRIAEYGLMALVGGVAVKKLGLFALLIALVLKFAKVIMIGAALLGAGVVKFFRRKPRQESDGAA